MTEPPDSSPFDRLLSEGRYEQAAMELGRAGGIKAILDYLTRTRRLPLALIDAVLDQYGEDERVWPLAAAGYRRSGELDKALKLYDRILASSPSSEEALLQKAGLLTEQGRLSDAKEALDAAPPDIEGSTDLARARANLLTTAGELDGAVSELYQSGGAPAVAEWFRYEYNPDRGAPKIDAALARFGDEEQILHAAAERYRSWGEPEQALAVYDRILAANPANVDVRLAKAKLLRARGRLDEAEIVLDDAPPEVRQTADFIAERAEVLATQGRFDDAASALTDAGGEEQVVEFLEQFPDWRGELLEAAIRQLPESVALLLLRASDALRMGESERSLVDYHRILELEPSNRRAQEGRERILRLSSLFEAAAAEPVLDTVFRAFDEHAFLSGDPWQRLGAILRTTGGPYGFVGPRGAGKSWLMLRAINWAKERGGIGLWFPSPSEYDSQAFLSSLSDSFANEIEQRSRRGAVRPYLSFQRLALATAGSVAVGGIFVAATVLGALSLLQRVAFTLGVAAALIGGYEAFRRARRAARPEDRLVMEASATRERIRFSLTRQEAAQLGAEAGTKWAKGRLSRSRQRELRERPTTLSSLIHDFRELARRAGETAAPVVIAIDELDKMDDPERVRALLRDVKAVFEVPRVHFLISVSH